MENITIDQRFCGPPNSGNGGYVSGILGNYFNGSATVTLRKPPPLSKPMQVIQTEEKVSLMDGEVLVAEAIPAALELKIPGVPSMKLAEEAVSRYEGFLEHPFETCFVCGPKRAEGDGLRIFSGRLEHDTIVASPWIPNTSLGNESGIVKTEFLWAALDCPGAYAIIDKPPTVVLGRITGKILKSVKVGEKCRVIGWPIGSEGRKYYSGTAVFNGAEELCAFAKATWIAI